MSDYMSSITVNCPAQDVFGFVSDVENMPQYLPTLRLAESQGQGRIAIEGEAAGKPYDADGWFKVNEDTMRMQWGSDGEIRYSGHLQVVDAGTKSQVTVAIHFEPTKGQEEAFRQHVGGRDAAIKDGLCQALQSIKKICEAEYAPLAAKSGQGYVS